ncbi:hypothetical protein GALL_482340 [mine drainage metagenome]|uniref:Uncharacterized protein n=1 Tax=mine drainage metagenome TaxID=410659 RepID=A0A1J5PRF6_9ZZZZ
MCARGCDGVVAKVVSGKPCSGVKRTFDDSFATCFFDCCRERFNGIFEAEDRGIDCSLQFGELVLVFDQTGRAKHGEKFAIAIGRGNERVDLWILAAHDE